MIPNRFCSGVKLMLACGCGVSPGLCRRCTLASCFDGMPYPVVTTGAPSERVHGGTSVASLGLCGRASAGHQRGR